MQLGHLTLAPLRTPAGASRNHRHLAAVPKVLTWLPLGLPPGPGPLQSSCGSTFACESHSAIYSLDPTRLREAQRIWQGGDHTGIPWGPEGSSPLCYSALLEHMTASPDHSGEELTGEDGDTGKGTSQAPQPQHSQGRAKDPHLCEQEWHQQSRAQYSLSYRLVYQMSGKHPSSAHTVSYVSNLWLQSIHS